MNLIELSKKTNQSIDSLKDEILNQFGRIILTEYLPIQNEIVDYFYILKGSYLVKGKTEQDLMKNYVNSRGARYASDRKYEVNLRKSYSNIKNNTNIHKLQNQINQNNDK